MASVKKRYVIYELEDPRNHLGFYIGKSTTGTNRPKQHLNINNFDKDTNQFKVNIIRSIKCAGLEPIINIIEEFDDPNKLSEAECEWIAGYRRAGIRITNLTDGGDGALGRKRSQETIDRHRELISGSNHYNFGKKASIEQCMRQSIAHSGVKLTVEHAKKISESNKGRKVSKEGRRNMSKVRGGKLFTDSDGVIWHTQAEASSHYNIRASHISEVLHGKRKKVSNYRFRYITPEDVVINGKVVSGF